MLTEKELAALLRVSLSTLRRWRMFRTGPTWFKVEGLVRYDPQGVRDYLNTRRNG